MSEVIGILGVALLFVGFALAQKLGGCSPTSCDSCDADHASDCANCIGTDTPPRR